MSTQQVGSRQMRLLLLIVMDCHGEDGIAADSVVQHWAPAVLDVIDSNLLWATGLLGPQ